MHLPPSTSLLLILNPLTSLYISFGQSYNSVSASSTFYYIARKLLSLHYFFMPLYLFLLSSVLFIHIALHELFFLNIAIFTSSTHQHALTLLHPPLFMPHTPLHAPKTPSAKHPQKFGMPTLTNFVTFSSNHLLIFKSFSKIIFLLSLLVFSPHSLFSSYQYLLPVTNDETAKELPSQLVKTKVFFFHQHKVNFCLIFSQSKCHLPLFHYLKPCI